MNNLSNSLAFASLTIILGVTICLILQGLARGAIGLNDVKLRRAARPRWYWFAILFHVALALAITILLILALAN